MSDGVDEIAMSFADAFADYMVANLLDGDADGGVVSMSPRNLVDTVSDLLADFLRDIAVLAPEARGVQPAPPTTCPTCGSDDPRRFIEPGCLIRFSDDGPPDPALSHFDSWHGEQR